MSSNSRILQGWINNIKKLDTIFHLAHGAIYADDESIIELKIDKNIVKAKVREVRGDIYDVEIEFRVFDANEMNILTEFIKNNPVVYNELFNNRLDDDLFKMGVEVFPDSLNDFKINCSCKNGLFCKHQAAIFHKLSREISENPFLVFSLRGLYLNDLINDDSYGIKNIHEVINNKSEAILTDSGEINHLVKLNLMLSDYPSFYPSKSVNFNEVLCDTLASMSKCIYQIHDSKVDDEFQELIVLGNSLRSFELFVSKSQEEIEESFQEKWEYPKQWKELNIHLNENYEISRIRTGDLDNNFFSNDLKYSLFAFLGEINQIDITFHCDEIRFLHELYLFTSRLINSNALIPEFFQLDNGEYHIRWIPSFEKRIYDEIDYFTSKCPENLLTFTKSKLTKKNQVKTLISLIFEGFCQYYVNKFIPQNLASFSNEIFFRLFFINSQDLTNHAYRGKEIEIDNWLSVLFSNQNDYDLMINTSQVDYKFVLQLKIRLNEKLYDFRDVVDLKRMDIVKNISLIHNIFSKSGISFSFLNEKPMTIRQYSYFIDNLAPVLGECGIEVNVPKEFRNQSNAKLILNINHAKATSSLTLNDLVDFDWKVAIGDETFTLEEFESFSSNFRGLVKIKDKYVLLDEKNLAQLREDISLIPENPDKSDMVNYLLGSDSDNVVMDEKLEDLVNKMLNVKEFDVPESLKGTLRKYQETGFSWMLQNMQLGLGSILADDMGLGKTIQVLAVILYLKENHMLNNAKVLVVAPTGILTNWAVEIKKFAPTINVEIYHGSNRYFTNNDYDVLLTSYGVLRRDINDFKQFSWFLVVADEAQNIKNPKAKKTKAVKSIDAEHHIALSGTPIENHLGEYWSIFDFTNRGYLKSLKDFRKRFINPIEKFRDYDVLDDFKKITSPFILRRLKTDKNIVRELPDKIINDVYCNLSVKQASLYDETLNQIIGDVVNSEGIQRKGLVLKLITSLKQICNHPSQFLKEDEAKINESGKMEVLMNILENIIESGEKVLIFTQYVQMGKITEKLIGEKFHKEVLFLHGGVHRKRRDKMIDEFQNGNANIFILSLKAGGTGLNLTAASNVIHYDLWWNPAVENQATDRAYRFGQTRNVMVYRLITLGTLEERINQILLKKRELVDLTITSGESFITEMSDEELREMLDLRNIDGEK